MDEPKPANGSDGVLPPDAPDDEDGAGTDDDGSDDAKEENMAITTVLIDNRIFVSRISATMNY